ncbi:DUF1254 domain-containing protein [Chloroflexota bacterium]
MSTASTAKARENMAYAIGIQAYIWGFPVIINEHSRLNMAGSKDIIPHKLRGPLNTLVHAKQLLTPEFEDVQSPNNDTLYTTFWLDLRTEPLILHVPDMAGRFYTYQFVDAYSNNFAYISQRTKGFQEMDIAICGPGWTGFLPQGINRIDCPTPDVFVIGRLAVSGVEDVPNVHNLQNKMSLVPLSHVGEVNYTPAELKLSKSVRKYAGSLVFFEELGDRIALNPPPLKDDGLLGLFKEIGLTVNHGFDPSQLEEPILHGLERAAAEGESIIAAKAMVMGREVNDWQLAPVAPEYFGTDYLYRAAVGWQSMYVNDPAEAYYPGVYADHEGQRLDASRHEYLLRFEAEDMPPVGAFWSTTMYDLEKRLMVANSIERYSIGDRTAGLQFGDDGSLEIYIQHHSPGPDKASNWLPAPSAPFYILMRLYLPSMEILNGHYEIPAVRRVE